MLGELIGQYQKRAQENFVAGRRPNFLPCETITGEHCSTRFARVAENGGAVSAITELMDRCPKGNQHAVKALGWSTLVALNPFGASSSINDPCCPGDPTAADPCGGGDPFSQDVAKCGDC